MTTTSNALAASGVAASPVTMEAAVGYPAIECYRGGHRREHAYPQTRQALRHRHHAWRHRPRRPLLPGTLPRRHPNSERVRTPGCGRPAAAALGRGAPELHGADRPRGEGPPLRGRPMGSEARGPHSPGVGPVRPTDRADHPHQLSGEAARFLGGAFAGLRLRGHLRGPGMAAPRTGSVLRAGARRRPAAFRYRGRDGRTIGSSVRFRRAPDLLTARRARWEFVLDRQSPQVLEWEVESDVALRREGPTPRPGAR